MADRYQGLEPSKGRKRAPEDQRTKRTTGDLVPKAMPSDLNVDPLSRAFDSALAQPFDSDDGDDTITAVAVKRRPKSRESRANRTIIIQSLGGRIVQSPFQAEGTFTPTAPLEKGEMGDKSLAFTPWKLIHAYPYRYVGHTNQAKVGAFFRQILDDRLWDMFYIHDPEQRRDPVLLVVASQFDRFLEAANAHLGTNLSMLRGPIAAEFRVTFSDSTSMPRPRYMGRVSDASTLKQLKDSLGTPGYDLTMLEPLIVQSFKEKMDHIYESFKNKKASEAKLSERILKQKNRGRVTKRVQRYLGLRQRAAYTSLSGISGANWNTGLPVIFPMEASVKFVCVDVEAYERNHDMVTEIGIAVLDTADLEGVAPGQNGEDWFRLISAFHLRIREHMYAVNKAFVQGCPESFNFGESEVLRLRNISKRIDSIIGNAYGRSQRYIVFVGHDTQNDLRYLKKVGCNFWRLPQFLDEIDTKSMFQRVQCAANGRSLQYVCNELGMQGRDYHNAGNDAVYTLQAMIAMAVRKTSGGPQTESERLGREQSTAKVGDWSDGELDDGGSPVKSEEPGPVVKPPPRAATASDDW